MWLVGRTPWGGLAICDVCSIICTGAGEAGRKGFGFTTGGWLDGGELGAEFELELLLLELWLGVTEEDGVDVEEESVEPDSEPETAWNCKC